MKIATPEELAAHQKATVRGAIEGVLGGLAISLPASYYFQRTSQYYRALPPHLKALGIIMVVGPCYAIQAEHRGVEYDKSTWTGAGVQELVREEKVEQSRWNALGNKEKLKDWAIRNQYRIILGSWTASMAVAGVIVFRNKYQTLPQKIVQARMWAQGLTIGILIGAGILTQSQRAEAAAHPQHVDHSWAHIIEEEEEAERQSELRLAARSKAPAP